MIEIVTMKEHFIYAQEIPHYITRNLLVCLKKKTTTVTDIRILEGEISKEKLKIKVKKNNETFFNFKEIRVMMMYPIHIVGTKALFKKHQEKLVSPP